MTVFEKCKAIKIIFNFIHKNFIFTLRPYSVKIFNQKKILFKIFPLLPLWEKTFPLSRNIFSFEFSALIIIMAHFIVIDSKKSDIYIKNASNFDLRNFCKLHEFVFIVLI
jgi:hypothetical protein